MKLIVDGFMLRSTSMGSGGIEEVRWLKPVRAGDQLTVRGTVTATRPSRSRPEMGLVSFLFEMFNAQGICVMTLKTPIMMGRREPGAPAA